MPSSARRGASLELTKRRTSWVRLNGPDHAVFLADLAPERGENFHEDIVPFGRIERLVLLPPESLIALVAGFDILRRFFNQREREFITGLPVVVPVDKAMLRHQEALELRILFHFFLHEQAKLKARTHPGHPPHLVAEDFLDQLFAAAVAAMAMTAFGCV